MSIYHRAALTERITEMVLRPAPALSTPSGVFLSAPRRTGKSTFLVEDLTPALEAQGALVIYVDLWSRAEDDPAAVLADTISDAVSGRRRLMKRLASLASVTSLTVGQVSVSRSEGGPTASVPVGDALKALSRDAKRTVVLIVDEAQHAITTQAGTAMLLALKSARDALSRTGEYGLRIVATGSNRDKLAMLRNTKDQAFFGAPLIAFPVLGDDYVRWVVEQQSDAPGLDVGALSLAFARAGHRPELLQAAVQAFAFELDRPPEQDATRWLVAHIDRETERANEESLRQVRSLKPLQSAVLREVAASGTDFAPFEEATMARYATRMPSSGAPTPSTSNVQAALSRLQEIGLVWRAARGVYALEDTALADLLANAGLG